MELINCNLNQSNTCYFGWHDGRTEFEREEREREITLHSTSCFQERVRDFQ